MRAPFYISLEVFNPIDAFSNVLKDSYEKKIHRPITLKVFSSLYSKICILKVLCLENMMIKGELS